jgi:uncharacterized protein (TIGR00251 family)
MDIQKYILNSKLTVKVIPNSSRTELIEENNQLKLYLKSVPKKNKANLELIKFFKKKFNIKVKIISGLKSRTKTMQIIE